MWLGMMQQSNSICQNYYWTWSNLNTENNEWSKQLNTSVSRNLQLKKWKEISFFKAQTGNINYGAGLAFKIRNDENEKQSDCKKIN